MDPFRNRRGRGGQFGEAIQASTFRRTDHPYGFALSRSRFAPVCGFFGGFATFINAAAFPSSAGRGILHIQHFFNSFTSSADKSDAWYAPDFSASSRRRRN